MRLTIQSLAAHLKQPLLPLYLVSGDEPFQQGEALRQLRAAALRQGHTEREVLEHDAHFDWSLLAGSAATLSLFGDKRLLELRLKSSKVGNDGSAALARYAEQPPPDTVLLIVCGKIERNQMSAKWIKTVDRLGALLPVWPIKPHELPAWLEDRMKNRGLRPLDGAAQWLAERVEGNLLAAVQELEKYLLLHGPGNVDPQRLAAAVADSARYSVFDLSDSALHGDPARCVRILRALRQEGAPAALVLWSLSKETRLLARLAAEQKSGQPLPQILAAHREIWDSRRTVYANALKRQSAPGWQRLLCHCAAADAVIKGLAIGEAWTLLEDITLQMAGLQALRLAPLDRQPAA
jgi:DNA polymerase-3 subunit delta